MNRLTIALLAAVALLESQAGKLVYSGPFLPEDDGVGTLVFAGKSINDYDVLSTVWDADLTLGNGYQAVPFFARRTSGELVVQLQHYNTFDSRCVKVVLRQRGDDIYGAVVYARYVVGSSMVGEDWDVFPAQPYKVHVSPAPGAADTKYGLGINRLTLATRAEAGDVVTEVQGDSVVEIASGNAYTAERVKAFDVPGFEIADSGLLNVLVRPNDKWDGEARVFGLPVTGEGGRVKFAPGAYGTRPDCADEPVSISSSTNAGFLGWSNAAKLLVAKNVPMVQVAGFACGLYYRQDYSHSATLITDTKVVNFTNDGATSVFEVRGYDPVSEVFRFVRVRLVVVGNDIWGYMDKLGSWSGTIDDVLDMSTFGNTGLCMSDGKIGLGVSGGQVLVKSDAHLGWSQADRHLVAPRVSVDDVTNFTGAVYARTGGVTKKMSVGRIYNFTRDGSRITADIRSVDPDDPTHVYAAKVFAEYRDGNLWGWISRIGNYYGSVDDDSGCSYTNQGISNKATQNGQGVCDFRPVCKMESAQTLLTLRGSTTAGETGVMDLEGGDGSALKATVKDVSALPVGVVNVRTNAELIVDGGDKAIIPTKTINVFRGGALRVKGDYELSGSTSVYLYGGEWQIGYGRVASGDAYQHAYYLYMANGARVWGAQPRLSNWQKTYWRVAGRIPSTVDCDVRLVPGSATNTGFFLDIYEVTGNAAEDLHFNGRILKVAGSKSPAEGGVPCSVTKRVIGTVAFNAAGCDFLDWFPLQIEEGAVRLGVSGVLASCVGGAPIEMSDRTTLIAAAGTSNSANTLKVLDNAAATIELETGASLTFSGLELGGGTAALTVVGGPDVATVTFTSRLTAEQLSRVRVKNSASDRGHRVTQGADGRLCFGGLMVVVR